MAMLFLASSATFAAPGSIVVAEPDGPFSIEKPAELPQQFAPALRLDPPPPAPVVVPADPSSSQPNRSTCRQGPDAPAFSVTMADIGYVCPVYPGDQAEIDAGEVTMISSPFLGAVPPQHPGQAGTLWIAGHQSSHGAPFADVPQLADGSLIVVSDARTTATYRIVGRSRVEIRGLQVVDDDGNATQAATLDAILRTDRGGTGGPRLLIQTCDGLAARLMIYADFVSLTTNG